MGFRFWRRVRLAPGVTLNLSKSGASLSFGPRGAKMTFGPRGKQLTLGLPGTGLFYTTRLSSKKRSSSKRRSTDQAWTPQEPTVRPEDRLTLGFFQRLFTPAEEEALVDGCRELVRGDEAKAMNYLRRAVHLADGAYLAAVVALRRGQWNEACRYFNMAWAKHRQLGRYLDKYGIAALMNLVITPELTVHVGPNLRGVLLALTEIYQRQGRMEKALDTLQRLRQLEPHDPVVKLSLVELLMERGSQDRNTCRKVVRLTTGVENLSAVHAALLLYRARALRNLGLFHAARDVLTSALRRKKDRPEELLRALRYERALVYEQLGQQGRARRELERIFAEDPQYEDVAARLGVVPR